jgi:hypothetical protein
MKDVAEPIGILEDCIPQFVYMENWSNVKLNYDTNFDAPDAHFDYSSLFSGTQDEKVGNPKKKFENCIRAEKKKYCVMKLS